MAISAGRLERPFVSRTIADCMIIRNKIYREWVVADTMAIIQQLGLDPHRLCDQDRQGEVRRGPDSLDIGENRRILGQNPPEWKADTSLAHNDIEAQTSSSWLHEIFNKRMFGKIKDVYAPTAQYHGPLMKELYGVAAVIAPASRPDRLAAGRRLLQSQHVASNECEEGGTKVAVRWIMEGHHLGYGILGILGDPHRQARPDYWA